MLWALYTSLRPYSDTAEHGYVSLPDTITFDNYTNAWTSGDIPHYFLNSLIITVPALVHHAVPRVVRRRSSSRGCSFRFNITLLMLFTAGNLLPQQVIITPLYRMYLEIPLPDVHERARHAVRLATGG